MMEFISEETFERALSNADKPQRESPFHTVELTGVTDTSLSFSWDFLFDDEYNKHADFDHYRCVANDVYGFVKSKTQSTEPKCTLDNLTRDSRYVVHIYAVFRGGKRTVEAPAPIDVPSLVTYATTSLDDFCLSLTAEGSGVSRELLTACEEAQALYTCRSDLDLEEMSARFAELRGLWNKEVTAAIRDLEAELDTLDPEDADAELSRFVSEARAWIAELRAFKYDFKKLKIEDVRKVAQTFRENCNESARRALRSLEEMLGDFGFEEGCYEGNELGQFEKDERQFRSESVFYEACREVYAWLEDVRGDPALLALHSAAARRRDLLALWKSESEHAFAELLTVLDDMSGDVVVEKDISECRAWVQTEREGRDKDSKSAIFRGGMITTAFAKKAGLRKIWNAHTALLRLNRALRRPSKSIVVALQNFSVLDETEASDKELAVEKAWDDEVAALRDLARAVCEPLGAAMSPVIEAMATAEAQCPGSAICTPKELTTVLLRAQECANVDAVEALRDEAKLLSTAEGSEAMREQCRATEEWLDRLGSAVNTAATAAEALERRDALHKQWAGPRMGRAADEDDRVVLTTCANTERRQAAMEREKNRCVTIALMELERCLATYGKEESISAASAKAEALLESSRAGKDVTEQEAQNMCRTVEDAWRKEVSAALLDLEITVSRFISGRSSITKSMCQDTLRWIEGLKANMDPCVITAAAVLARKEEIVRCWKTEATRALLELRHTAQSYAFSDSACDMLKKHTAWADAQLSNMNPAAPTVDVIHAVEARREIESTWRAELEAALTRLEATVRKYRAVPGNPLTERKCAYVEAKVAEIRAEPYPGHATAADIEAMGEELRCVWLRERRAALNRLERAVRNYGMCEESAGDIARARGVLEEARVPDSEADIGGTAGSATATSITEIARAIEAAWSAAVTGELEAFAAQSAERWPEAHAWAEAYRSSPLFDPRLVTSAKVEGKSAQLKSIATTIAGERLSDLDVALSRVSGSKDVCSAQSVRDAKVLAGSLRTRLDGGDVASAADLEAVDAAVRATEDAWAEVAARSDLRNTTERLSLCGGNLCATAKACAAANDFYRSQQVKMDLGTGSDSWAAATAAHRAREELIWAWRNELRECGWDPYFPESGPTVAVDDRTVTRTGTGQIFGTTYAKVLGNKPANAARINKWVFRRPAMQNAQFKLSTSSKVMIGIVPAPLVMDKYDDDDLWKKHGWFISWKEMTKHHAKESEKYGNDFVAPSDTITMRFDPTEGTLSFALNGATVGTAFSNVTPDVPLFPAVMLPDKGDAVELISSITYSKDTLDLGKKYVLPPNIYKQIQEQGKKQEEGAVSTQGTNNNNNSDEISTESDYTDSENSVIFNRFIKSSKEPITFTKPAGYESFAFNSSIPIPHMRKTRWAVRIRPTSSTKVFIGVKRSSNSNSNGGANESDENKTTAIYFDCLSSTVLGLPDDSKITYKTRVKGGDLVSVEADTAAGLLTFYVNFKPLTPSVTFMNAGEVSAGVTFVKSTVLFKTGDIVEIY